MPILGDFNGDGLTDIGQHRTNTGDDTFMLWLNCWTEDLTTTVPEQVIGARAGPAQCGVMRREGTRILLADPALFEPDTRIETYDPRGALVYSSSWGDGIDPGPLAPGVYVLRASSTFGTCVSKVVIE